MRDRIISIIMRVKWSFYANSRIIMDVVLAYLLDLIRYLSSVNLSSILVSNEYILVCYDIILCIIRDVMIIFTIVFIMTSDPIYFGFMCVNVFV